jgi:hypothetical protein
MAGSAPVLPPTLVRHATRLGPVVGSVTILLLVWMGGIPIGGPAVVSPTLLLGRGASSDPGLAELEAARASLTPSNSYSRDAAAASSVAPSLRAGAAMTWDAADSYVLLFGGCALSSYFTCGGSFLNDTWEYSNGSWAQVRPEPAPPPLALATMAYDSTTGTVVLFGGQGGGWNATNPDYQNFTWEFHAGAWTNISGAVAPSQRESAAVADDPSWGGVVLFGGVNEEPYSTSNGTRVRTTVESDTWAFAGGVWNNITTSVGTPPPARSGAGMTYDPSETGGGAAVLFGGESGFPARGLNDTWLLRATGWEDAIAMPAPPSDSEVQLTYLSEASTVILFGGYNQTTDLGTNATWSFSNGNWTLLHPSVAPLSTWGGVFVDDPAGGYGLLFLGQTKETYTSQNALWTFADGNWTALGTNTSAPPAGPATMVYDAADQEVLLVSPGYAGSTTGLEATWAYKSGNWSRVNSTLSPPALPNLDLVYDAADGYVLMVGEPHGTYAFGGDNWTEVSPQSPGSPGSVAYDAADGYVVYFSGDSTWKWLAGTWTQLHPTTQPILAGLPAGPQWMTYDARDGYVLFAGPENASCPGASYNCLMTWSFSHGNWTDITTWSVVHPPPFLNASLTYDAADQEVILFGGHNQSSGYLNNSNETWGFAVGNWTLLSTASAPSTRVGAAMAYDVANRAVMMFGGVAVTRSGGLLLADTWSFSSGAWTQVAPSLVASETVVDQNVATSLQVLGTTFYPDAAYTYRGLPPGCASADVATLLCTPTGSGSFTIRAEVTSPATAASDASLILTVTPHPSVSSFLASPPSIAVGQSTRLTVVPAGGTGPFDYSYGGLPPGCSSANTSSLSCIPSASGNFTVTVSLTDRFGLPAQDSLHLSVSPSGVLPGHGGGLSGTALYEVLAAAVAGVSVAVVVTARWSTARRLQREGEELVAEMRDAISTGPGFGKPPT